MSCLSFALGCCCCCCWLITFSIIYSKYQIYTIISLCMCYPCYWAPKRDSLKYLFHDTNAEKPIQWWELRGEVDTFFKFNSLHFSAAYIRFCNFVMSLRWAGKNNNFVLCACSSEGSKKYLIKQHFLLAIWFPCPHWYISLILYVNSHRVSRWQFC